MATVQTIDKQSNQSADDYETGYSKIYRILGLVNGLLIGLAVAVGVWGPQLSALADVPIEARYTSYIIAVIALLVVTGFAGWISALIAKTWSTMLLWLFAGMISSLIITYQSNHRCCDAFIHFEWFFLLSCRESSTVSASVKLLSYNLSSYIC